MCIFMYGKAQDDQDLKGYEAALGGRQFFIEWRSGKLTITCQHSDTGVADITKVSYKVVSSNFYCVQLLFRQGKLFPLSRDMCIYYFKG